MCSFCFAALPAASGSSEPETASVALPPPPSEGPSVSGREALLHHGRAKWGADPVLVTDGLRRFEALATWPTAGGLQVLTLGASCLEVALHRYERSGDGFEVCARLENDHVSPAVLQVLDQTRELSLDDLSSKPRRAGLPKGCQVRLSPEPALETDNGRVTFVELLIDQAVFDAAAASSPPAAAQRLFDAVQPLRRAAIRAEVSAAPSRSHAGGHADLSPSFEWPAHRGQALSLLLQLELSELPPSALPREGRLLLFGPADDAAIQPSVSSWNEVHALRFVPAGPSTPRAEGVVLPAQALTFTVFDDLPRDDEPVAQPAVKHALRGLRGDDRELALECYADLVSTHLKGNQQLLGYHHPIQDRVRDEPEWVPLLQLDSDARCGWNFCGHGMLFAMIRREDLAEWRFDRVEVDLQR